PLALIASLQLALAEGRRGSVGLPSRNIAAMHDDDDLDELRDVMEDNVSFEEVCRRFDERHNKRRQNRTAAQTNGPRRKKNTPPGGLEDNVALAFAEQHADDLRYVAAWSRWMSWTGSRWQSEDTLSAFDLARKLCREHDKANAKMVAAVTTLARSDRPLAHPTSKWDTNPSLFNTGD